MSGMPRTKLEFDKFRRANLSESAIVTLVLALMMTASVCTVAMAQQPGQKTFSSAEAAIRALMAATKNNDEKAMLEILGPKEKEVVSSGDDAEDAQSRANFVDRYQEMHRLVREPDGTTILYIGAHTWPTPIPLERKGNVWYFDTEAGKKEILYRRIGRNELSAIRVCQELVASEKEYAAQHGGEYAHKIFSDEGQQDGLYWKSADGQPQSPIGPLVASAVPQSFAQSQTGAATPYRGYYFHILERQGKGGAGGAKSYTADGKMTGFAFVAYPAEYRSSGVMTFVIGEDGVVYEKDLGRKTEVIGKSMKEYDPTSGWQRAEEQQEQAANARGPSK